MKKIFIISLLFFTIFYAFQKTSPVFHGENSIIEEFSNDEKCLNAVRRISAAFPNINTITVLCRKNNCLCGITTDNNTALSKNDVNEILYDIFPEAKKVKTEINTGRAEDIMELSYFGSGLIKEKYIALRFDFLISED